MKMCTKCKADKDESEYNFRNKTKGTLQAYCKECHNKKVRVHYKDNKQYYIDKATRHKNERQAKVSDLKSSGGCVVCYESEPACLDFHHLSDKVDNIATMIGKSSMEAIYKEIEKCIILCANCHRKFHAGVIQLPRIV